MIKQDFKFIFTITFLLLFLFWFVFSFFAISYEEGTNNSLIPKLSYHIASLIMFSIYFWSNFLNELFAMIFSLLSSTFIVSTLIVLFFKLKRTKIFKKD
jgi:hypothetical protein